MSNEGTTAESAPPAPAGVRRLNWGCGEHPEPGLAELRHQGRRPASTSSPTCARGCRSRPDSIDYITSIHALPELPYPDLVPALTELRRVLKPGGVLRLALPDLERAHRRLPARGPRVLPCPGRGRAQHRREVRHADDLVRVLAQPVRARLRRGAARAGRLRADHPLPVQADGEPVGRTSPTSTTVSARASSWRPSNSDRPVLPRLQAVHRRRPEGLGLLQPRALIRAAHGARALHRRLGVGRDQSLERRP